MGVKKEIGRVDADFRRSYANVLKDAKSKEVNSGTSRDEDITESVIWHKSLEVDEKKIKAKKLFDARVAKKRENYDTSNGK